MNYLMLMSNQLIKSINFNLLNQICYFSIKYLSSCSHVTGWILFQTKFTYKNLSAVNRTCFLMVNSQTH